MNSNLLFCYINCLFLIEKILNLAVLCLLQHTCSSKEANEYDSGGANLEHLGLHIFRQPDVESGRRVREWNESSEVNPEELGNYAEGDIVFPPEMSKNGVILEAARWPNGVVPYEINGNFTVEEKGIIHKVMEMYHEKTCLKFRLRQPSDVDWVNIISNEEGCWSSIGRTGGSQRLNLQTPYCLKRIGTVIHELLHAVGFLHEQCSSDRDLYVNILWENIREGKETNFQKGAKDKITNFGIPYDYGSVMHYSKYAFSKNNKPTIHTKDHNAQIGQRKQFSKRDIQKVRLMYNCPYKINKITDNGQTKQVLNVKLICMLWALAKFM